MFVYTGPSWANSSFPILPGNYTTNLAKEWNIPYIDCSKQGSDVMECINLVKNTKPAPIVWVYNEPLKSIGSATKLTIEQLIERSDWQDIRRECNNFCLKQISDLNRPVFLIGGHSDVLDCNYPNITVGCNSWQKFLVDYVGINDYDLTYFWGADFIHNCIHMYPDVKPSKEITNAIWDVFQVWEKLEKALIFYKVHPNLKGNRLFANFLKPSIIKFLEDNK